MIAAAHTRAVSSGARVGPVLLAAAVLLGSGGCSAPVPPPAPAPVSGPSLGVPRAVHRATTLLDGRVLFTGGCSERGCEGVAAAATTAVFDPRTAEVRPGPRLEVPRLSHTATRLPDGRVLVVGGYPGEGQPPTDSIEVFDPRSGAVLPFGRLRVARADHTATVLPDGRVLVAGGRAADGSALRGVELLSPDGTVGRGPDLPQPRTAHTATATGPRVLLVGGTAGDEPALGSTVVFDGIVSRWTAGPPLLRARVKHAAVALPDGGVLVLGGASGAEASERFADTELLPAGARRFAAGPALPDGRYKLSDAVAALPDGTVAVAGGPTVGVIDVAAGTVRVLGGPALDERRSFQSLTVVAGGRVLVAGGYDGDIAPTAATWLVPLA